MPRVPKMASGKISLARVTQCCPSFLFLSSDHCLYIVKNMRVCVCVYTECLRRNVPDFGRVFLMLNYTDITQNTYIQSLTVTEIMARKV